MDATESFFPPILRAEAWRSTQSPKRRLFERGVIFSDETVRRWCDKFGACVVRGVKMRRKPGTMWHLDEVFVTLRGAPYLFVLNVSLS